MILSLLCVCAHMHALIPETAFPERGRGARIAYMYCHPFEHEVEETPRPEEFAAVSPAGERIDLLPALREEGEGFSVSFRPPERVNYCLLLRAPPAKEDGVEVRESAKLILHVQSDADWDRTAPGELDIVPLTRPYGLAPGTAFRGRVVWRGAPAPSCEVELEKYNAAPPARLPRGEFITVRVKTDAAGVFVATLPEAGWWCLRAAVETRDGGAPVRHAMTFWVPVGEP